MEIITKQNLKGVDEVYRFTSQDEVISFLSNMEEIDVKI